MASFKSFLSAIGHEAKVVFTFLGSAQGQKEIATVEGASVAIATALEGPAAGVALAGIENLLNGALKQVVTAETVAVAADQQSGTGIQKASNVASALSAEVAAILKSLGIPSPAASQVQSISSVVAKSMADIVNAFPAGPAA